MPCAARQFSRVECSHTFAAKHVNTLRDHLQVIRVDARSLTAQMIKYEPRWNRALHQLVRNDVRAFDFSSTVEADREFTVPITR
jgi:hypothetical protein